VLNTKLVNTSLDESTTSLKFEQVIFNNKHTYLFSLTKKNTYLFSTRVTMIGYIKIAAGALYS
jgi:hypothetical protein